MSLAFAREKSFFMATVNVEKFFVQDFHFWNFLKTKLGAQFNDFVNYDLWNFNSEPFITFAGT